MPRPAHMTQSELSKVLELVERLADMPLSDLRALAATGKGGRYSPTDAKAELGEAFNSRGALVRIIAGGRIETED